MKVIKNKNMLALLLVICMLFSITACAPKDTSTDTTKNDSTETKVYNAGTYTGIGKGRNGDVTVEVVVDDNSIVSAKVVKHEETAGISDIPVERIPAEVVEYQSLGVDTIAGATMTSDAIIEAISDCITQAGGDVAALMAVGIEKTGSGELVKKTADVIILGGGGAGVAAAYAASEQGSSVIVVEKTASLGGNTMRSGGYMNAVIPENEETQEMTAGQIQAVEKLIALESKNDIMKGWQDTLKADFEAYTAKNTKTLFDSLELHMLQTYVDGDYVGNPVLIENFVKNAPETYKWLEEKGMDWKEKSILIVGSIWPRSNMSKTYKSGIGFIDTLADDAEDKNLPIEYDYEIKAEELIMEGNKVVGVKATAADGTPYEYKANKGVIIATGGFGANVEMRVNHNSIWADLGPKVPTTNSPAITGDGIIMAEKVGANLVGMDKIQLLIADPKTGETSTNVGDTSGMYVNQEGLRFVNESERRDVLCSSTLEQTNGMMYIISSFQNSRLDKDFVNTYGIHVDDLIARGAVFKGDTIEELAEKIGIEPAVLRDSVDKFNAAVEKGYDDLTGRTTFNSTAKIEDQGPYYANPRSPAVHHTMGGIEVDINAHVLDKKGNIISGLYSAGEVTGGFHGANRLGGNAISEVLTTGRIAGLAAAQEK